MSITNTTFKQYLQYSYGFTAVLMLVTFFISRSEQAIPIQWMNIFLVIYCSWCAYSFLRNPEFELRELITSIFVCGCVTWAIYYNQSKSIYWSFPTIIALFHLLPSRKAIAVNIPFVASVGMVCYPFLAWEVLVRLMLTLSATSIFSYFFARRAEIAQNDLFVLAHTDPLTGLPNRRAMIAAFEQESAVFQRYHSQCSIMMIDIDHFKQINDKYGHYKGDLVLKEVAQLIKNRLRESDQVFRYGGEEFIALLPHTDQHQSQKLAQQIRKLIERSEVADQCSITISIGLTAFKVEESWSEALSRADQFMYKAKQYGRNRCVHDLSGDVAKTA